MGVRIFLALVAAVAAATAVLRSSAATYRVGDSNGWNTPSGGFNYSNWATQHTFMLGDILEFDFITGQHTASRVNQADYNNCNTRGNPISIQTNGPANFTLNQPGPWYFICTESNHCSVGQKLLVNVTSAGGSPNGSPSPGSYPTTPFGSNASPPPPPPNSAYHVPTTTAASLIFLFTAMAFLF